MCDCNSAGTWDQSIYWKNKAFKSTEECRFAYSCQGFIPSKKQLCSFFFILTQLSSLRNEVCCAGILFSVHSPSCSSAPYANLWKQSTFLLPLTLGGSSFHHITAIQPINHPLLLHEKEPVPVPGLRKPQICPHIIPLQPTELIPSQDEPSLIKTEDILGNYKRISVEV